MKTTPPRNDATARERGRARISIIVPAFNVEDYVREAVESALAQTVPAHEIIIIDDGSDDRTSEVLAEFEGRPSVRLYRQVNQGVGPTRNRGALLATGDYIYFFDADDILDPRFVESIGREIARGPAPDVILFSGQEFTDAPELESRVKSYARLASGSNLDTVEAVHRLMVRRSWIQAPAWLYVVARDFWSGAELSYPGIVYEDENVIMPLLFAASSISIVDEVLFHRRLRPGSTMTRPWDVRHCHGRERNLIHAVEMISQRPSADKKVKKLLRRRCRLIASMYLEESRSVGYPVKKGVLMRAVMRTRSWKLFRSILRHVLDVQGWKRTAHRADNAG